jgi:hypothetical protein
MFRNFALLKMTLPWSMLGSARRPSIEVRPNEEINIATEGKPSTGITAQGGDSRQLHLSVPGADALDITEISLVCSPRLQDGATGLT